MGLEAIYPKPRTSRPHPAHKVYPYLLRNLNIDRPNHVWAADITYIPMSKGFMYLVAVMDWHSRRFYSSLSNTLDSDFCVEALEEALRDNERAVFEHRSRRSIYQQGNYRSVEKSPCKNQHGRPRTRPGQYFYRAAM